MRLGNFSPDRKFKQTQTARTRSDSAHSREFVARGSRIDGALESNLWRVHDGVLADQLPRLQIPDHAVGQLFCG